MSTSKSEHTNDEYICISAHWVDKDWKLQKRIIRFKDLSPLYDVRCCAHILNLIVKIGLDLADGVSKNSKSTSSFLAGSSNVSDNDPVYSSLQQLKFNRVDLGGDYDKNDDYKRYLNASSIQSEKSLLDIYLDEPELELNSQIDVLDYWSKSSIRDHEEESCHTFEEFT
ncbi:hypothetical protein Golob_026705 [Gossypium lobatum]|uniref:Uncharacterized protein n=1 Tax=Gossypium lobatum TaxID=34289 RepID=A0A7J8LWE5_9ROSI|nr:hypothetical protein [Gossypium lobatum]